VSALLLLLFANIKTNALPPAPNPLPSADDNFATIIAAVKEGRRVWDNIRKLILFNMPVNLAQGTSVMYAYVLGFEHAPLVALQVLLVNLVTAVTLGLTLAAEPPEPNVMEKPPRRHGKRLIGKLIAWRMFAVAHLIDVFVLLAFWLGKVGGHSLASRRAESFNVLVGCQVAYFVTCRFIKLSTVNVRVLKGETRQSRGGGDAVAQNLIFFTKP
jgi:magnesium-transporting ATPase (P-type)